ncbi:ABC transporter, nucleotide binding/ATPase protein [Roseovarius sp. EC-HK134]|uniref:High-affinity branched-chain amino acid transport ATP-binding protein LivF n=1 Tax=Roseovarius mucosus TaxID=215743 RepID=A0A1V0RLI3_9RHOB|nr:MULTISPECIES: urea ABC transporter ATP-binding subunit UrtE [Roseovarius]ARE82639.1 high-affinity branched-chain amino acid transport ATP-binding protein LivF [Roseovarius mucosus]AWZ18802.1 Urea ABC transporter, ATPase protein UrtE [Roseovarius sp. AK1035]EDM32450.1 ABC transporter, nucleotide binding/ATPase protein [Roseovarius sp. TM1035]MBW4973645.1 urea ABC transporter ATP-binding subunit UrtE [Roseovarius mucosus]VVS98026.1 ABC transporter, nucleotide binding/ATPase protein [Roseovari|tara:strand:- start:555 stop:1253 length:699 start_codon:yes stop_codon:yes gene_type:complete
MLLQLEKVSSFYGRTQILRDIDFGVTKGTCMCVLGRNGVGKTTLLRTIMGLVDKMTGTLSVSDTNLTKARTDERAKYGLGYVPQGRQILGNFTVRENILLGTFAKADRSGKVPEICLDLFPYLAENLNRRAGELSGGQQQQLAISRALAVDPQILLLDEPTEGIQPNIVAEIGETLRMLNKKMGISMILSEQHIKVARDLGDQFVMMDNGRIVESGVISDLTDEMVDRHMTV